MKRNLAGFRQGQGHKSRLGRPRRRRNGTTATEQHPIHQYQEAGEYIVVLTVQGPEGTARRVKVRQVVVR